MLLDAYLRFDSPEVAGDCADPQFKDQIRILSVDLRGFRGEFQNTATGTLSGAAGPRFDPIRVIKQLDKSTPLILKHFTGSTAFKQATFSLCQADPTPRSTSKIVYLQITLSTVQIIRYAFIGNPAAFRTRDGAAPFTEQEVMDIGPLDEFDLSFAKIDVLYKGPDGKANISMSYTLSRA